MKFTFHIQLQPYNGVRYDFIEVELEKIAQIPKVYEKLEQLKEATQPSVAVEKFEPNAKQIALIKALKGSKTYGFKDAEELHNYINKLQEKKKQPKKKSE